MSRYIYILEFAFFSFRRNFLSTQISHSKRVIGVSVIKVLLHQRKAVHICKDSTVRIPTDL